MNTVPMPQTVPPLFTTGFEFCSFAIEAIEAMMRTVDTSTDVDAFITALGPAVRELRTGLDMLDACVYMQSNFSDKGEVDHV